MSTVLQNRDRLLQRHDGPGGSQSSYDFTESSNGFTQSSYGFTQSSYDFTQSSYDFTESRYGFTQSSYGFTVLTFTQSSFIIIFFLHSPFFFFFHSPVLFLHGQYTVHLYFLCSYQTSLALL